MLPPLHPALSASVPDGIYLRDLPLLLLLISLVYSATRFDRWGPILREAFRWGLRLTGFLFAVLTVLYLLATYA